MFTGRRVGFLISGFLHLGAATMLLLPGAGEVSSKPAEESVPVTLSMFVAEPVKQVETVAPAAQLESVSPAAAAKTPTDASLPEPPEDSQVAEAAQNAMPSLPIEPGKAEPESRPEPIADAQATVEAETVPEWQPDPEPQREPKRHSAVQKVPQRVKPSVPPPPTRPAPLRQATAPALITAPAMSERSRRELSDTYLSALVAQIDRAKYYPRKSRRRGEEGTVVVRFVIQRDGRLDDIVIVRSSGVERLDEAAQQTLRKLGRTRPIPDALQRDNWPISVPIAFNLRR